MNDLLKNLNDEQIEAVKHNEGPCLVLAGAGSGKTKVLTNRIAYLIENGVRDYNILAITFTNKAAKEMRDRVYNLVGDVASFIGTFHSLGLRIIRENCGYLNLPSNFSIIDSDDNDTDITDLRAALNDLTRYKEIVKHKYQHYLDEKYSKLLLQKIELLEQELKNKVIYYQEPEEKEMEEHKRRR